MQTLERLWRRAHLARGSWELPPETTELMRDLARRQRETVNLYVVRDLYRACVAQRESPRPLRHVVRVGDGLPLWAGASATVCGSATDCRCGPARQPRSCSARPTTRTLPASPATARTAGATSPRRAPGSTRRPARGWAVSHGEREAGLSAVAVPVAGRTGTVIAALSPSGPSVRFPDERVAEFVAALTEAPGHLDSRGFDHPFHRGN